jgi:hypothetical protein
MRVSTLYPCPVCGYLTFAEPPGSYDNCAVCGWEDDALQLEFATTLAGGANRLTLADAQAAFAKAASRFARKNPGAVVPRDRDPTWRPIDPSRDFFPVWEENQPERAPSEVEQLYYWRETFWRRAPASNTERRS